MAAFYGRLLRSRANVVSAYQSFYDFYTNNVGKKDFIETIEPQNHSHKILYRTSSMDHLLWTTFYGRLLWPPSMAAFCARCARART
jgi:hypothetical protein